ncbi:OmpA family protein [Shewanella aestuarii]|uniref:Outer membrane beta-barrel protein n=1 Tax=Shewanella aestuarii TaxID=1028752 RepID=A0ABT0L1D9_9GAMM|nr:OmpA family protein [Shewanella aestuarii]MCL1117537.1 outer membrane beta-barrel protein [Shewanella aestuarii]GGN75472.1 hypothetical protein GCM10009193_15740 [Shewanella aestuarii]
MEEQMLYYRIVRNLNLTKQLTLLTFLCFGSAQAAEQSHHLEHDKSQTLSTLPESYFYLGGEIGINYYQHGCESWSISCDKNSTMSGFFAGYQLNNNLALEAAYLDLGKAEATYLEASNKHIYQGSMTGINLSAVGSIDLTADLSLFAKAGLFNWYGENKGPFSTIKADDWSPSLGVGMSYQLSDSWQARLQYEYFHHLGDDNIGGSNAHTTSIGISYQFGRTRPVIITNTVTNTVTKIVMESAPIELEEVTFPVLFDFDSSKLISADSLQMIVNRLTKYPQATVLLRGYSDSQGSSDYNLALSKRRTDSITEYLVTQGVQQQQITVEYYGEQYPAVDNITEQHRHLNRRVQVLLPKTTIQPLKDHQ